ncbi:jg12136 [Pararge aegeria aegeria]|uniref:Jg12136 protein n=1 Tax=Pararge aegeria aegeria TaxID=348720 RepID=A0A8S4S3H2_9NEOP|nr:jg12136 [Pararge aegeria aegeria]
MGEYDTGVCHHGTHARFILGYLVTITANNQIEATHHTRSLVGGLAEVRDKIHSMIDVVLPRYRTPVESDLRGFYREVASLIAREEHRYALPGFHLDPTEAEPLVQQLDRLLESTGDVTRDRSQRERYRRRIGPV